MHKLLPALVLFAIHCVGRADVLPPQVVDVGLRMQRHPNLVDRIERHCSDRKPGDACVLPGTPFSGGGAGSCKRTLNTQVLTIDLVCDVESRVIIDRQLPGDDVGWVHDASLCRHPEDMAPGFLNCKPLATPPVDVFCRDKAVGAACVAEMRITGRGGMHRFPGVCARVTERQGFYYQGRREMTRDVIRCEAPALPPPEFETVGWFKKLFQ